MIREKRQTDGAASAKLKAQSLIFYKNYAKISAVKKV